MEKAGAELPLDDRRKGRRRKERKDGKDDFAHLETKKKRVRRISCFFLQGATTRR